MAVSSDGATLYVAGFGSSEVGVYSTAALENDTFVPSANDQLPVSGGAKCASAPCSGVIALSVRMCSGQSVALRGTAPRGRC